MTDRNWRQQAACIGHNPEDWFPDNADRATREQALFICSTCPVMAECRGFARGTTIPFGVFGGESQRARNLATGVRAHNRPLEDWQWDLKPCGTEAAYKRHQRKGEKACAACLEGYARLHRERGSR